MDPSVLHSIGGAFHTYLHDFSDGAGVALHSAHTALFIILNPTRMLYLFAGVCMGLALGILPGIGGIAGTALLLPFTYDLDPPTAFALLLGLGATTTTADPIAAILFGAPGHAASAATTLDGYPMTRRGEAGRALGASYMAALIGGLFGALLMAIALPIMRPIILYIGSPELLSIAVFGISMVAVLSGNAPLRGLTFACFGMMLRMIGTDPQSGTLRWTMGTLYLWDGLPLVPLTLGIFALPELCDLAIGRMAVVQAGQTLDTKTGMMLGIKDCRDNWFLILRCSWIGSAMGAIPGIGASVIDWISYGHALKTEKDAAKTFGTGDVRGVIAAESATNAREGGALVPTVAFGVPASAGMAILLGAFLIHGLVPGPDMLTKHLDLTYSMVWSIAIANILGSGLCFAFSGQLAKIATLRYTLFMPCVLSLVFIGAFEATRNWGDLFSLMFFGVLGWAMKHFRWPRPPFVLGFILGEPIERYMFISIERYGVSWMIKPFVLVMFGLAAFSLLGPLIAGHPRPWRAEKDAVAVGPSGVLHRQSVPGGAAHPVHCDVVAIVRLGLRRPYRAHDRRHRRHPVLRLGSRQRHPGRSCAQRRRGCRRRGIGEYRAKANSHGYRVEDRASARRDGRRPRLSVLRLDGRNHAADVDHRVDPGGTYFHHFLHAVGRAREVEDRDPDGGVRRSLDLHRVRSIAGDPVAANVARNLISGAQGDSERVNAVCRATPGSRLDCMMPAGAC